VSVAAATLRAGLGGVNVGTLTQVGYLARRSITRTVRQPILIIPSLVFPLFLLAVNSSGLEAATLLPGFPTDSYLTFALGLTFMQGALFATMGAGQSIAGDIQHGFFNRLQLTPLRGPALIAGYAMAALARALLVWVVVTVVALATGAEIAGSVGDLLEILVIAVMLNFAATLFASGMAMRFRTLQAAPLIQLPAFLIIMTAPVYVPRDLIEGWVATVAGVNPMTATLEAARNLIIGAPAETLLALGVAAGLIAVTINWARTGLRRAEAAG